MPSRIKHRFDPIFHACSGHYRGTAQVVLVKILDVRAGNFCDAQVAGKDVFDGSSVDGFV